LRRGPFGTNQISSSKPRRLALPAIPFFVVIRPRHEQLTATNADYRKLCFSPIESAALVLNPPAAAVYATVLRL